MAYKTRKTNKRSTNKRSINKRSINKRSINKRRTNKKKGGAKQDPYNQSSFVMAWYPSVLEYYEKKRGLNNLYLYNNNDELSNQPIKHGKFAIFPLPEKYYSPNEYIIRSINSVDEHLAHIAAGCNDPLCMDGTVPIKPYHARRITVSSKI